MREIFLKECRDHGAASLLGSIPSHPHGGKCSRAWTKGRPEREVNIRRDELARCRGALPTSLRWFSTDDGAAGRWLVCRFFE